jgi:hypothetical protein
VQGTVTSTATSTVSSNNFVGNRPSGAVISSPRVAIPYISARRFYTTAEEKDSHAIADWYDLCPGGEVRPYSSSGTPCSSSTLTGTATSSQEVRGWRFVSASSTWIATRNALPGTYYAHEANIDVGTGNATLSKMTLVASAINPGDCAMKRHGNITWDHYTINAPAYQNMFMLADTDIVTKSGFTAGSTSPLVSGMFVAGDQIDMSTSSQGAVGSVLAGDQCAVPATTGTPLMTGQGLITQSIVKNPSVFFDPNAESPFTSVITVTLWLDYTGG